MTRLNCVHHFDGLPPSPVSTRAKRCFRKVYPSRVSKFPSFYHDMPEMCDGHARTFTAEPERKKSVNGFEFQQTCILCRQLWLPRATAFIPTPQRLHLERFFVNARFSMLRCPTYINLQGAQHFRSRSLRPVHTSAFECG